MSKPHRIGRTILQRQSGLKTHTHTNTPKARRVYQAPPSAIKINKGDQAGQTLKPPLGGMGGRLAGQPTLPPPYHRSLFLETGISPIVCPDRPPMEFRVDIELQVLCCLRLKSVLTPIFVVYFSEKNRPFCVCFLFPVSSQNNQSLGPRLADF